MTDQQTFMISVEARYLVTANSQAIAEVAAVSMASAFLSHATIETTLDAKVITLGADVVCTTAE